MNLERTTTGINKAEDVGGRMPIGFADALPRALPTRLTRSLSSWLDPPRGFVRSGFSNIGFEAMSTRLSNSEEIPGR